MKAIIIERRKSKYPLILNNGDKYDSTVKVLEYDNKNIEKNLKDFKVENLIYQCPFINTDHTENYKGGELKNGNYYYIIGLHKNKYPAPLLFQSSKKDYDKLDNCINLTYKMRTLPSSIINPNHKKKIITYVNFHKGGLNWDWSHGCMTMVYATGIEHYWNSFMSNFQLNDKGIFILEK